MIYSIPRNFLFLRVPKTASTSINAQILDKLKHSEITAQTSINYNDIKIPSVSFDDVFKISNKNYHPKLKELIQLGLIKEEDLLKLNIYAIIREPIDRTISCAYHFYNTAIKKNIKNFQSVETLTNDLVVEKLFNYCDRSFSCCEENEKNDKFVLNKPQTDWFIHNNYIANKLFKFNEMHKMLEEICGEGSLKYNYRSEYRINKSKSLCLELRQECRKRFPKDFAIWESL